MARAITFRAMREDEGEGGDVLHGRGEEVHVEGIGLLVAVQAPQSFRQGFRVQSKASLGADQGGSLRTFGCSCVIM